MFAENKRVLRESSQAEIIPSGKRLRALTIAMLAAAAIILAAISNESLWIDEGGSAYKAIQPTLSGWWQAMLWEHNSNMQLPLYLIGLWGWEKLFGSGEIILRLANAPFFFLTIYGLWMAFRKDPTRFNISILLLLTNAFTWFYLNEARPYILILGSATVLFALVYRLKEDTAQFDATSAWVFTGVVLLLCATSMIAAPWVACAFCAIWYLKGKRFPLEFIRRFPASSAVLLLGMIFIGSYYTWSLKIGADVPGMGKTGFENLAFMVYELFGFAGLGPPRNVMRIEFMRAFPAFYLPLAIYGTLWTLTLAASLCKLSRPIFGKKNIGFYLILFLPVVIIMLAGYVHGIRVLPRYLTPSLPLIIFLASYLAASLWKHGHWSRGLVVCLMLGGLISCLEIRFAPRHAKDDYRSATAVAKKAAAKGEKIYWAADVQTAIYYGLINEKERDFGSSNIFLFKTKHIQKSDPDLIVLSKTDLYDKSGNIRTFLRDNKYVLLQRFQSFQLWHKPTGSD
ncbi:MAG TPA: hypothetical protein VJT54_12735 [Verrucomicrobiae bacterium]|nr:hypothetical protein [Verrucomicrobiae bacterium]